MWGGGLLEMNEPPKTAIPVAMQWPTVPPAPRRMDCSPRLAQSRAAERSPTSAAQLACSASITSGQPPLTSMPDSLRVLLGVLALLSDPGAVFLDVRASTSDLIPK